MMWLRKCKRCHTRIEFVRLHPLRCWWIRRRRARTPAQPPKTAFAIPAEPKTQTTSKEPDVPLATNQNLDLSQWQTELLEYTHDAVVIWEMHGAGILYWNLAAEQLYGYSRSEAQGQVIHRLLKTQLAGGVTQLEAALAKYGVWVGELQHTTRDGTKVNVEGRLALMSQRSGRWLILEVNRDVTDRKAANFARIAMERQLAELQALRH